MTSPFAPRILDALRAGYSPADLRADALAGLTVAIVALPLAMAIGIASGATPQQGLITVVVAGLLISLLGGSRMQIGGPTAAFIVVVYDVIERFGYDGLIVATLMAGAMLILAGLLRLGVYIRHIPHAVVTGFTCGIAVIIVSSQIRDLFGLDIDRMPGDFVEKWRVFWDARATFTPAAAGLSLAALALIVGMRRYAPRMPAFLIAVAGAALAAHALHLPVPTIGSMFGEIPRALPLPHWPDAGAAQYLRLFPSALTIAFLAGIESLLSAVIADRMTGDRHRSNTELVAQGLANCASALCGGMPATGAIARTATNIRAGARSPIAGVLHALFALLFVVALAPLAAHIPLAVLAAVLLVVAWYMSEREHVVKTLRGPWPDRIVMLATLLLTVFSDLTVAIAAGVILSAALARLRR